MGYCDEIGKECEEKCTCIECLENNQKQIGCECCLGDEPLYWKDNGSNAFVDSKGEILVTVKDRIMRYKVKHCPNCGRKF